MDEPWLMSKTPMTRMIGPVPQTQDLLHLLLMEV